MLMEFDNSNQAIDSFHHLTVEIDQLPDLSIVLGLILQEKLNLFLRIHNFL